MHAITPFLGPCISLLKPRESMEKPKQHAIDEETEEDRHSAERQRREMRKRIIMREVKAELQSIPDYAAQIPNPVPGSVHKFLQRWPTADHRDAAMLVLKDMPGVNWKKAWLKEDGPFSTVILHKIPRRPAKGKKKKAIEEKEAKTADDSKAAPPV